MAIDGVMTAEWAAGLLLVGVFILAVSDKVAAIAKILLSLFSIGYLLHKNFPNQPGMEQLLVSLSVLVVVLFGYYIMFGGLNRKR